MPNSFSQSATKLVEQGKSIVEARAQIVDAVRKNFADFLARSQSGAAVALFLWPDQYASQMDKRLWQKIVGHRTG